MGKVEPFQLTWSGGMRRDDPRDNMPEGTSYNLVDWIPDELGSPLAKRGGWSYESNDISATKGTASYVINGIYAPFAAASKNLCHDEDGELYSIAANGTVTDIGASLVTRSQTFHRDQVIICSSTGAAAPKYYNGSTLGNLGGSPPSAFYTDVYKDRTVLARTTAQPPRVYFSGAGDPTSWDTTYGYVDADFPVTGVASLRNALIVFSSQQVERIIGSTPPPGTDMSRQTLFRPGCADNRSIFVADDTCFFANPTGLYQTDGAAIVDVTERGGMKRYWVEQMASYTTSWSIACGRFRNWLLVSIMNGSSLVDAFMVHIYNRTWLRVSNLKATSFWSSVDLNPETYFGLRGGPRVCEVSSMWAPAAGVKNDADGTAVTPILETPWVPKGASKALIRDVYLNYDLRDAATDNPTIACSYILSPELTSYAAIADFSGSAYTLAETTEMTRVRRNVRHKAYGIAFKLAQSNASATTRLYRVETDEHKREMTSLAA